MEFKFYNNCIFCNKLLPGKDKRGQEHVIPSNIYGFWTSYDVCTECMHYFGEKIDNLPQQSTDIQSALKELSLKKSDALIKYEGLDKHTKEKFSMFEKKGKYIINTKADDKVISVPEEDMEYNITKIIKQRFPSKKDIKAEVKQIISDYYKLEDNNLLEIKKYGLTLRKGVTHKTKPIQETLKPMTPLIAKILVCFLKYFLTEDINKITMYQNLIDHARWGKPLPHEYILYYAPETSKPNYDLWHRITFDCDDTFLQMTVRLFGHCRWMFYSPLSERIQLDSFYGDEVNGIALVLTIEEKKSLDFVRSLKGKKEKIITNLI